MIDYGKYGKKSGSRVYPFTLGAIFGYTVERNVYYQYTAIPFVEGGSWRRSVKCTYSVLLFPKKVPEVSARTRFWP